MAEVLIEMTTEIVSSYVSGNQVSASSLPEIIKSVYQTLATVEAPAPVIETSPGKATPAQIRKSIKPDGLVSFEDGKTYQTLKRHLSKQGMSLAEYKEKWGLPKDYPTTSPSYSERRSQMAKALGLGQNGNRRGGPKKKLPAR